jgi:hypothetical protein
MKNDSTDLDLQGPEWSVGEDHPTVPGYNPGRGGVVHRVSDPQYRGLIAPDDFREK